MKHVHNKNSEELESKESEIIYYIKLTDKLPKTKTTKARREFYKLNSVLKSSDIFSKKFMYIDGKFLKNHDLHYDFKNGFIVLEKKIVKGFKRVNFPFKKRGRYYYEKKNEEKNEKNKEKNEKNEEKNEKNEEKNEKNEKNEEKNEEERQSIQ